MSAATIGTPVFNCPSWCATHSVYRDTLADDGGAVRHNSRHHIVLASDESDPLGAPITVYAETATRLFTGEVIEDYGLAASPVYVAMDTGEAGALTAAQAREVAAALVAAAEVVERVQ